MRRLLDDTNPRIRLAAAGALLSSDPDQAAAHLVVSESLVDPSARIRRSAMDSIISLREGGRYYSAALMERRDFEDDAESRVLLAKLLEKFFPPTEIPIPFTAPEQSSK